MRFHHVQEIQKKIYNQYFRQKAIFSNPFWIEEPMIKFRDSSISWRSISLTLLDPDDWLKFYRMYPSCVILDKLTDSDIAYAILVYENGFDVWSEDAKVRLMSSEDKDVYDKTAVQKYHVKKGTRLRVYMDGWLPEGRAHHDNMKVSFQKLRMETHFWDNLRDYWRIYVKENHKFAYEKGKITSTEDPDNGDEEEQGAVLFDFPLEPVPLPACEEERLC